MAARASAAPSTDDTADQVELDSSADATAVPAETAPAPASVPFDRAQQRRRLQEAERKLAQLGRVNPLALEEFAALEQR
ncbi:hypothetical protein ABTN40_19455, partial [Acinetobacter baumannii]